MSVMSDDVGAILTHLGDAKPGDISHSVRCDAVSACRARRITSSRSLPGGRLLAYLSETAGLACEAFFKRSLVFDTATFHDATLQLLPSK